MAEHARHWPAAGSTRMATRLGAPARPATVLAAFPTALYLRLEGHADVLPVVSSRGLRLPTALALATELPWVGWGVQAGEQVLVGSDEVRLPGATIRAVRAWRPWHCPSPALREWDRPLPLGPLPWRGAAARLTAAVLRGESVDASARALLGAGAGLTPSGDDVLCGVLIGLRLTGRDEERRRLWAVVEPRLATTTSLSAALLTEAAAGYAVPPVARLVDALVAGDGAEVRAATVDVRAVGHTSGADLLGGLVGALDAVRGERSRPGTLDRSAL